MKSYTDLKQSKKLVEILSPESADMFFVYDYFIGDFGGVDFIRPGVLEIDDIPCWSLAALLDQLEDVICDEDGNEWELVLKKENVQYDIYYLNICGEQDNIELDHFYDDLVDCCYEMILKLKEKDLI